MRRNDMRKLYILTPYLYANLGSGAATRDVSGRFPTDFTRQEDASSTSPCGDTAARQSTKA